MIVLILIIFIFLLFVIQKRIQDSVSKNLVFIYLSYWIFSLLFCKINIFGYYPVHDTTYYLLLAHLVCFVFGYCWINPSSDDVDHFSVSEINVVEILKSKIFVTIYGLSFLFILTLFFRQRALLAIYSLKELRGDFMEYILGGSGGAYLFFNLVATPLFHLSQVILCYMLFFDRKWPYIFFVGTYAFVFAVLGGGRVQLMMFGYYMLGIYLLSDRILTATDGMPAKFKMPRQVKLVAPIIIGIIVVSMSFMSSLRQGHSVLSKEALVDGLNDLSTTLGEYSAGPIVAFDIALNDPTFKKDLHYGRATINGTDYFLYIALHRFGLFPDQSSYHTTVSILQNEGINISPDRRWNYAYTSCMFYYYDFAIWGVLLIPLFLGIIARYLIGLVYKRLNIWSITLFCFISYCLYMSVFSGYIHKMFAIFFIILLFYLSKRGSKQNVDDENDMVFFILDNK